MLITTPIMTGLLEAARILDAPAIIEQHHQLRVHHITSCKEKIEQVCRPH
jgi:hypothetical protein